MLHGMDRNDILRSIENRKAELTPVIGEYEALIKATKGTGEGGKDRAFTAEETTKHVELGKRINAINSALATDKGMLRALDLSNEADDKTADELGLSGRHKLPEASDEYRDAFEAFARGGFRPDNTDPEKFKMLSTVSPSTGGVLIPTEIERGIMMEALSLSPLLALSRVSFTTSRNTQMPFGARIGLMGPRKEAEAYVLTDPVLTNKQIDIYNYGAFLPVSQELMEDTEGLDAYFAEIFGEAYAETVEEYGWKGTAGATSFTNQAGSGVTITLSGRVCPGIRSENSTAVPVVTAADDTTVAANDVINLKQAVNARYRNTGAFVMSGDFETKVLLLKDGDNRPLWQPNFAAGQPPTLFGSPYYVSDRLAAVAAEANVAFFGDFKRGHEIRIRKGLTVKRSDHFLFGNGMIALAADVRWGAKVKLNAAIARLNMAAAG